jgi:hypothetical protein
LFDITIVQDVAEIGLQFDDQPPKVLAPGTAVRVTVVLRGKLPVQVLDVPQVTGGAGLFVTVPTDALFPTL